MLFKAYQGLGLSVPVLSSVWLLWNCFLLTHLRDWHVSWVESSSKATSFNSESKSTLSAWLGRGIAVPCPCHKPSWQCSFQTEVQRLEWNHRSKRGQAEATAKPELGEQYVFIHALVGSWVPLFAVLLRAGDSPWALNPMATATLHYCPVHETGVLNSVSWWMTNGILQKPCLFDCVQIKS